MRFVNRHGREISGVLMSGKHLDIAASDAEVIAVPLNRSVDELAVHAGVRTETDIGSPLLKIEEIAEKLKCAALCRAA